MTKKFYLDMHREQLKCLIPLYQTAFREASYKQFLIHLQKKRFAVRKGREPSDAVNVLIQALLHAPTSASGDTVQSSV